MQLPFFYFYVDYISFWFLLAFCVFFTMFVADFRILSCW